MTRDRRLGIATITGPAVWLLTFGALVSLSDWPCRQQDRSLLFFVSVVAVALTATALMTLFGQWRQLGKEAPAEATGPAARWKTAAIGGLGLNALFLIVLIAQTIPVILLKGCE